MLGQAGTSRWRTRPWKVGYVVRRRPVTLEISRILLMTTRGEDVLTNESDVELLHVVAFVVFFPFSAIYLAARWLVNRQKDLTRSGS